MIRVRTSFRRSGGALAALAVAAVGLVATAAPAAADAAITSAGPLDEIAISSDLNCSVDHVADDSGQWYDDTACATVVAVDGKIFGPADIPAASSLTGVTGYTPYTAVGQTGPAGAGSAADPFVITTTVSLGDTGLVLTQRDSYVIGQETTRTDVVLSNSGAAKEVTLYRAADCYLQDDDSGTGALVGSAITCTAGPDATDPDRIQQFVPITPGSRYLEDDYDLVWEAVGTGAPLPNTCLCDEVTDNGMALSWDLTVPAAGSATVSSITAFSPTGAQPVQVTKTVTPGTVAAGGLVTYTITVSNPGVAAVSLSSVSDTLPAGFTYQAGTTTGGTTSDPTVSGQTITWAGPLAVPGGGEAALSFTVQVSDVPGTYNNSATGVGDGLTVIGAVDVAPVDVLATTTTLTDITTTSTTTSTSVPVETTTTSGPVETTSTTVPDTTSTTVTTPTDPGPEVPVDPGSVQVVTERPGPVQQARPATPMSSQASYTG